MCGCEGGHAAACAKKKGVGVTVKRGMRQVWKVRGRSEGHPERERGEADWKSMRGLGWEEARWVTEKGVSGLPSTSGAVSRKMSSSRLKYFLFQRRK